MNTWKQNWEESKKNYLDWWQGKGLVVSMWEHFPKEGAPHAVATPPPPHADFNQYWFDPVWRAQKIHYDLSRSCLRADIPPVANTHLGPGSLCAILGAELSGDAENIWAKHIENFAGDIVLDKSNKWYQTHIDLMKECKKLSQGQYYVGCPDLIEGLDTLASLRGTQEVLMDTIMQPEVLEKQLQKVNDIWFEVFDDIYEIINEDGEMAFCYFSIWGPGKVAKLQSDISLMISEDDYRRFVQPYIRQQAQFLDYSLYHLDGVDAMRHLDAILEINEINCVQWTPGIGEPQGGNPRWFDLYQKILDAGKGIMPCWVETNELKPLLDAVGAEGLNILMHFQSEKDVDNALKIVEEFR